MEKSRIGFIGLGLMGSGMVRNLLSDGYQVMGYDADPGKIPPIIEAGGKEIKAPEKIATQVDVIMLSLPNSDVVEDVVRNSLKLFDGHAKGLVLIDTTTADPIKSEALAAQLRGKGVEMLDATISGTSKMCAERDITFMVGGDEKIFHVCKAIFGHLGKETFYLGKNGSGATMKLIVNLVLGLNRMVLAEGLSLAKKAGMDLHRLLEVLKKSAAYSKAMDMKGLKMIENDFLPPEGTLSSHRKDVQLMLEMGTRLNQPLFLSSLHAQALAAQVAKGRGNWDISALISFYNDLSDVVPPFTRIDNLPKGLF